MSHMTAKQKAIAALLAAAAAGGGLVGTPEVKRILGECGMTEERAEQEIGGKRILTVTLRRAVGLAARFCDDRNAAPLLDSIELRLEKGE